MKKIKSNVNKRIDQSDRVAIEIGISKGEDFKTIAKRIHKHPSSVSNEIKNNRSYVRGVYPYGNDCKYVKSCFQSHLCGDEGCYMYCHTCSKDCHNFCKDYKSSSCLKHQEPPYVCNTCNERRYCRYDRYFYSAKLAHAQSERRKSSSRSGIRLSGSELENFDSLITGRIKKGQPISHIYASCDNLPVSKRTAYNYINQNVLSIRNMDLRRQAGYKKRRKKSKDAPEYEQRYRRNRSYEDYKTFMENRSLSIVTQMDTVKGCRARGQVLLTMLMMRNHVMLMFLMPDATQESVIRCFDFLEEGLGKEAFKRLFGVFLTDNGSEFKNVDRLELSDDLTVRTNVFYCDPMASWQKAQIEKNHEYIRYAIPKRQSLNQYTEDDIVLLMNHINSTRRESLMNRSPYEMVSRDDRDMLKLMQLMKMEEIPDSEINLTAALFNRAGH